MTREIYIVGTGYAPNQFSYGGYLALRKAEILLVSGEVASQSLGEIFSQATLHRMDWDVRFLELRSDLYARGVKKVVAQCEGYERIGIPVLGSPFLFEGIASGLRLQPFDFRVMAYPGPSTIDSLLEVFPGLISGHGFQVIDTSANFFSVRLNPLVDLILLQYGRAGSKRHALAYVPNLQWLRRISAYLSLEYPASTVVSAVVLGNPHEIHECELGRIDELFPFLTQASTLVVRSPFKPRPDSEHELLAMLVSPLEVAIRR